MSQGDVAVVIAARNEEGSITQVLAALEGQTLPPRLVVVVDDGSTDGTAQVLSQFRSAIFVLSVVGLPHHEVSYVGRPELAGVFNAGLAAIRESNPVPEFVMILGGDHVLPRDYLAKIVARMKADPMLAIAGGWIAGEPYLEDVPRGSSMLVRTSFWEQASGMRYPRRYGWESWLYLKAMKEGFRTRSFKDVPTSVSRQTSTTKGILYGRAMYSLGYYWPYAVGRSFLFALRSPKAGVKVLAGYLGHQGVERQDVADWVGQRQQRILARRALRIASRLGRS